MRKTFNLLFICLTVLYGWIGYPSDPTQRFCLNVNPEGSLSDVAEGDRHPFENKRTLFFEQD